MLVCFFLALVLSLALLVLEFTHLVLEERGQISELLHLRRERRLHGLQRLEGLAKDLLGLLGDLGMPRPPPHLLQKGAPVGIQSVLALPHFALQQRQRHLVMVHPVLQPQMLLAVILKFLQEVLRAQRFQLGGFHAQEGDASAEELDALPADALLPPVEVMHRGQIQRRHQLHLVRVDAFGAHFLQIHFQAAKLIPRVGTIQPVLFNDLLVGEVAQLKRSAPVLLPGH
mmetsp:Transcript_21596/g.45415  ORF Transcript_21596/g.45415 Transcript_21596/m.45415 type:complete len:228 (+) Transcript_21596:68-751(+)